ncbi:hypothetical protein Anapl_13550 [Anas platyrhynchos]|uniref:Uncharacterized protein n=1 Tax=Anas platyrhynchos TaxID=8839 RepID=R0JVL9_ANAPL|nr:hypothetical protein Anapl_13550 [Anas platyrhynchos]
MLLALFIHNAALISDEERSKWKGDALQSAKAILAGPGTLGTADTFTLQNQDRLSKLGLVWSKEAVGVEGMVFVGELSSSTKTPTTGTTQPSPQEPVTALEMKRGPGALSGRQSKCTGRCPQVASDQIFAIPKTPI